MIRTVVVVEKLMFNEEQQPIDKDGVVVDDSKMQASINERYYLLHWGKRANIAFDKDGFQTPYEETVGVCQHLETGWIKLIDPESIRVEGHENIIIKK